MFKTTFLVDIEWVHRISYRLDGFKKVYGKNVWNARCPRCGDSKKKKKKQRFYIYEKKNSLNVDCKNCGYSRSFYNFVRETFPDDFEDYKKALIKERFSTSARTTTEDTPRKPIQSDRTVKLRAVTPLNDLSDDHDAVTYMKSRGFSRQEMAFLLYSHDFKETAESVNPTPLGEKFPNEPRIVIPFYNKQKQIQMIQGRTMNPRSSLRYISIKKDADIDKIFGLDRLNTSETSYCVEGPLDSLFVDNCLATCDSNLIRSEADVLIFDNQPRNKELIQLMMDAIERGKRLVIWPTSPNKKIDINDMILMGLTRDDIMSIIKQNTFSGLKAKLQLMKWKRISV